MTKLYPRTYAVMGDDARTDTLLARRVAALGFIRPHHLDIPEHFRVEARPCTKFLYSGYLQLNFSLIRLSPVVPEPTEVLPLHNSKMASELS